MKIIFLCGNDINSNIVYNYLKDNHNLIGVVEDLNVSKKNIIKKRIRKLGFITVLSQLLFIKGIVPFLKLESKKRKEEILSTISLKLPLEYDGPYINCSVNDLKVIDFINSKKPDVIVVNGTRILSKNIIEFIEKPIINIHVGITPKYRGVHGGYWAICNGDINNCGVTVHLVDAGIDTGGILSQKNITIQANDNFITYPLLQTLKGLECLDEVLTKFENNEISVLNNKTESKLYYHPTVYSYLKNRIFHKVK
jgi:folate-dependent phosphoribosylglycinamide formyltransferase PurN